MIWLRWLLVVALLAAMLFCMFGVVASFEPLPNAYLFRVVYAVTTVMLLGGILFHTRKALLRL